MASVPHATPQRAAGWSLAAPQPTFARRFVCEAPATDPEVLAGQLRGAPGTSLE